MKSAVIRGAIRAHWLDAVCVLLAAVVGIAAFIASDASTYPIVADGNSYVEAAANYAAGNGLTVNPADMEPYSDARQALRWWPPALPLLIAAVSAIGLDVQTAAIWIPRILWLLALPLAIHVFKRLGVRSLAGPLALQSAFSPGLWGRAAVVASEIPFYFLVLGSFALLSRAIEAVNRRRAFAGWGLASGVTAGLAYATRNVGVSLLGAIPLAIAVIALLGLFPGRRLLRLGSFWIAGAGAVAALVKLRGLFVFGELEPYIMPPSTRGVIENLRWMVSAIVTDITGSPHLGVAVAWNWLLLSGLMACGVAIAFLVLKSLTRIATTDDAPERIALATAAGLYCVVGIAVVVVARSRYELAELINARFAAQYTPLLAVLIVAALEARPFRHRYAVAVVAVIAVALFSGRVYAMAPIWTRPPDVTAVVARDAALVQAIRSLPPDAFVVSNEGRLLTSITGRGVRELRPPLDLRDRPNPFAPQLEKVALDLRGERTVYAALVLGTTKRWGFDDGYVERMPRGYTQILERPAFRLFRYDAPGLTEGR